MELKLNVKPEHHFHSEPFMLVGPIVRVYITILKHTHIMVYQYNT